MAASAFATPRPDDLPAPRRDDAPDPGSPVWTLQRNCSATPGCLAGVLGVLAVVSFAIAAFFWHRGAVLVVPFAAIEVAALTAAFLWYARHATDGERLWFEGARLVVRCERGGRVTRHVLDATWLDVQVAGGAEAGLVLRSGAHRLVVGTHAGAARRERVAREIRLALRQQRPAQGQ